MDPRNETRPPSRDPIGAAARQLDERDRLHPQSASLHPEADPFRPYPPGANGASGDPAFRRAVHLSGVAAGPTLGPKDECARATLADRLRQRRYQLDADAREYGDLATALEEFSVLAQPLSLEYLDRLFQAALRARLL